MSVCLYFSGEFRVGLKFVSANRFDIKLSSQPTQIQVAFFEYLNFYVAFTHIFISVCGGLLPSHTYLYQFVLDFTKSSLVVKYGESVIDSLLPTGLIQTVFPIISCNRLNWSFLSICCSKPFRGRSCSTF